MAAAFNVPTQATAFYDVSFDPIGFYGSGRFAVADACLATDGWKLVSSCGVVTLQTATATLFDTANPLTTTSLTFAPPVVGLPEIQAIYVNGGQLDGADTALIGPQVVGSGFFQGYYWLQFVSGQAPVISVTSDANAVENTLDSVRLWRSCDPRECPPQVIFTANDVTFTRVNQTPEPGTMALLLGAAASGMFLRRRQRGRSEPV